MGAGVSLSLSRNGFLVDHLLGVSVPFPREYGFCVGSDPFSREQAYFGKNILLDFQTVNDTSVSCLHDSFMVSAPYSKELELFGEINLPGERDLPKEHQRWLIRKPKAVVSPDLQRITCGWANHATVHTLLIYGRQDLIRTPSTCEETRDRVSSEEPL